MTTTHGIPLIKLYCIWTCHVKKIILRINLLFIVVPILIIPLYHRPLTSGVESPRQPFEVMIRNNTHDQWSHEPVLGCNGLFPLVSVRVGVLERCNHRYRRLRLLANKKWGPSPATLIQIYKQCIRPIFEYGSLSTVSASDNIISKIQRLQNKFIRLALRLPKYIIPRLLHDSTGLPYVKDRLLTRATKSLDRIAQNP